MMDNGGASIKIRTEQYLGGGARQGRIRHPLQVGYTNLQENWAIPVVSHVI